MAQFTTICVWFVITLIVGAVTFFIPFMFMEENGTYGEKYWIASWIIATLIAGIAITVLLVQNGLLQW